LRRGSEKGSGGAALNRDLAEALYHRGRIEDALECGRRAFALSADETTAGFCAWLFSNCGQPHEAAAAYRWVLRYRPEWAEGYRHLSGALSEMGEAAGAVAAACRAVELAPDDPALAIHAAELLLRAEHTDEAANVLMAAPPNPPLLRVLSGIEMVRGRPEPALSAIDRALAFAPERADYHLHRGHVLQALGRLDAAAAAFGTAAALDDSASEARRAQLAAFIADGRLEEATAAGGEMLQRFPDDEAAAAAVLHLLNHRLGVIDGEAVVPAGRRAARPPRPVPGLLDALRCQVRVVHALLIRETRTRFGDARLGYGWAVIEPLLHIAVLWAMFALLMHGQPPLGRDFFLFYYTGLLPYHVFVHTSTSMTHAVTSNGALLQLPRVTPFDVIVARGLLEFATDAVVAVILLGVFAAAGIAVQADDLWGPCAALATTAVLGCGVGFINAIVQAHFRSWDKIWVQATRILYFASGIFYVPAMMPDWARDMLVWNPLLQAIDWFRVGFYPAYDPPWLDRSYLAVAAVTALASGLALERVSRRHLSEPP
jgi:capsular polysaccharide transport system permease protein